MSNTCEKCGCKRMYFKMCGSNAVAECMSCKHKVHVDGSSQITKASKP